MLQVGNSVYYNYTLSVNGKREDHGSDYEKDYLTKLIVSIVFFVYFCISVRSVIVLQSFTVCQWKRS